MTKTVLFVCTSLLILFSCQTNTKSEQSKFDYSVKVNEQFTIDLSANPSTGYSWKWANSQDSTIVKFVAEQYSSNAKRGVVGAGGTAHLQFKGIKKGRTTICLHYLRPWEMGAQPARKAVYEIEVK